MIAENTFRCEETFELEVSLIFFIAGVYFSAKVENIKFVDFCGKYRLPLLEYLCSPNCARNPVICASSESESEDEVLPMAAKMKKVLLG